MEKFEVKNWLKRLDEKISHLIKKANLDNLLCLIEELEKKTLDENFWKDQENAKKINKELAIKKEIYTSLNNIKKNYLAVLDLFNQVSDSGDFDYSIFSSDLDNIEKNITEKEIYLNLGGKYDDCNAFLEIHPGSGGTEAQDWALMILRMYERYSEKYFKGFKIVDIQQADVAGIKSAIIEINGDYAYGYLKGETGVHRLVRISPFDSNKRRHTSFASVLVMPKIENEVNVLIKEEDLKIDTYHSSGAGGQSVNTTMSAVRITHIPTKIVITCQDERSQIQNKEKALNLLKSKLVQLELEKRHDEENKLKGEQKEITWGSQIRSYIFQPYQLVKDHRTNYEEGNIQSVMDGEIDNFIKSYLNKEG